MEQFTNGINEILEKGLEIMTVTEKLNAFYFLIISHEEEVKRHWADSILVASSIAEDNPPKCIVLMRPNGVEYFNLDSSDDWSFDKATYYRDLDNDGCHLYLLDFENIKGLPADKSIELSPQDAVKMIMDVYKKERKNNKEAK